MASWIGSGILADCRDSSGHLVPPSMLDPSSENTFAFLKEFFKGSRKKEERKTGINDRDFAL